jgi:hypothetical protein
MDFVSDELFDGRRRRALTVVDALTCQVLAIDVDQGIRGEQVVETMTRIALSRGAPRTIRVDNGPEFISKALDRWAYESGVTLDFSRPGKPTDNAFVESFNADCATSASTPTGSCRWRTLQPRSRPGGGTITRAVLTRRLAGSRRSNMLLPRQRSPLNEYRILSFELDEKPGDPQNARYAS